MNSRNTTKMVEHKFVLFATFKAFWTLVTLRIKLIGILLKWEYIQDQQLCHFVSRYVVRAKLFCLKSFVPVTGLECSYGKIFIPVTEISVAKTEISVTGPYEHIDIFKRKRAARRDLGNRASPADRAHMKRPPDR